MIETADVYGKGAEGVEKRRKAWDAPEDDAGHKDDPRKRGSHENAGSKRRACVVGDLLESDVEDAARFPDAEEENEREDAR